MTKAVRPRPNKTPAKASMKAAGESSPKVGRTPLSKAVAIARPATSGPAPVFVHSSFRTSSTWLWKHFRDHPAFRAYYEIFHEALGGLGMDGARSFQSDQWRSRHPASAPYFLEFIPLMDPAGGIRGFADEPAVGACFFPDGGIDGNLSSGEMKYVAGLIANAQGSDRIPVLTCTRTLGRAGALKRKFGGTHILLHRNLFHQWNSFSGQHRTGNLYFLEYLFLVITRSRDDAFMELLRTFTPGGIETDFQAALESRYDDIFAIFTAWHVYMTLHAMRTADIVIDATRLAKDNNYRHLVEDEIRAATGQSLDLADATTSVDAPWRTIQNPDTTKLTVRLLVDSAYAALGATAAEKAQGDLMITAAWAEHEVHATYARAYLEAAEAQAQRLPAPPAHALPDHTATAGGQELALTEALATARSEAAETITALTARIDANAEALTDLKALRVTLEYERIAREAAMAETAEVQRVLAEMTAAHEAARDETEHMRARLAEAEAEIAEVRAGEARTLDRAEILAGELMIASDALAAAQQLRDEAAAARDALQIRMEEALQENSRLAGLTEDQGRQLEGLAQALAEAENGAGAARQRVAEGALREAELAASLNALSAERDHLGRLLEDHRAELASIKQGVSWRAASTLRRLGVG